MSPGDLRQRSAGLCAVLGAGPSQPPPEAQGPHRLLRVSHVPPQGLHRFHRNRQKVPGLFRAPVQQPRVLLPRVHQVAHGAVKPQLVQPFDFFSIKAASRQQPNQVAALLQVLCAAVPEGASSQLLRAHHLISRAVLAAIAVGGTELPQLFLSRGRLFPVSAQRSVCPPRAADSLRPARRKPVYAQQHGAGRVRQQPFFPVVLKAVVCAGPQSPAPLPQHHRPAVLPQVFPPSAAPELLHGSLGPAPGAGCPLPAVYLVDAPPPPIGGGWRVRLIHHALLVAILAPLDDLMYSAAAGPHLAGPAAPEDICLEQAVDLPQLPVRQPRSQPGQLLRPLLRVHGRLTGSPTGPAPWQAAAPAVGPAPAPGWGTRRSPWWSG